VTKEDGTKDFINTDMSGNGQINSNSRSKAPSNPERADILDEYLEDNFDLEEPMEHVNV